MSRYHTQRYRDGVFWFQGPQGDKRCRVWETETGGKSFDYTNLTAEECAFVREQIDKIDD
jgi:hypothetical protein